MVGGYKVVTLCGSTRFRNEYMEAQKKLTLEGCIVISVGLFGHSGDSEVWENMDAKKAIMNLKGRKWYVCIDGCVITVNAGSYTIITAHREK